MKISTNTVVFSFLIFMNLVVSGINEPVTLEAEDGTLGSDYSVLNDGSIVYVTITNQIVTDISVSAQALFKIYPNLSDDGRFIIRGIENIEQIRIYDLNGRQIWEQNINGKDEIDIELRTIPGVYMVQLIGKNQSFNSSLVIK
jgi:hypothetical protein